MANNFEGTNFNKRMNQIDKKAERKYLEALALLSEIKANMDITGFTVQDVDEVFNHFDETKSQKIFKSDLDYLVAEGFLHEENGIYSVNLEMDPDKLKEGFKMLNDDTE